MNDQEIKTYCELLSNKIVAIYGISKELANYAVQNSAIQILIREEPEYVDHVPLSSWAEEVYEEMIHNKFYLEDKINNNGIKRYCELLSNEIVKIYGVSKLQADYAIQNSAIQALVCEDFEYVCHMLLSSWAEKIYKEMFNNNEDRDERLR